MPSGSPPRGTLIARLHRDGYRRRRTGTGFSYATRGGKRPDARDLERIRKLAVPPAWTEVAVARSPAARLQAVGRDRAGRWQYRYSPAQERAREETKRRRLAAFLRALPALRARVARDLEQAPLSRERVMSAIVRILCVVFPRPGSAAYASENGSYGLATLRSRHVSVRGSVVALDFPGKSGQRQRMQLADRRVARVVRELKKVPGRDLFQYRLEDGAIKDVRRRDINAYIAETMGRRFTAKDFRTWAGSLLCAERLSRVTLEPGAGSRERRKAVVEAIRDVAGALGNTPAVCRSSYVSGCVMDAFEAERLAGRRLIVDLPRLARRQRPSAAEKVLLGLLERRNGPSSGKRPRRGEG